MIAPQQIITAEPEQPVQTEATPAVAPQPVGMSSQPEPAQEDLRAQEIVLENTKDQAQNTRVPANDTLRVEKPASSLTPTQLQNQKWLPPQEAMRSVQQHATEHKSPDGQTHTIVSRTVTVETKAQAVQYVDEVAAADAASQYENTQERAPHAFGFFNEGFSDDNAASDLYSSLRTNRAFEQEREKRAENRVKARLQQVNASGSTVASLGQWSKEEGEALRSFAYQDQNTEKGRALEQLSGFVDKERKEQFQREQLAELTTGTYIDEEQYSSANNRAYVSELEPRPVLAKPQLNAPQTVVPHQSFKGTVIGAPDIMPQYGAFMASNQAESTSAVTPAVGAGQDLFGDPRAAEAAKAEAQRIDNTVLVHNNHTCIVTNSNSAREHFEKYSQPKPVAPVVEEPQQRLVSENGDDIIYASAEFAQEFANADPEAQEYDTSAVPSFDDELVEDDGCAAIPSESTEAETLASEDYFNAEESVNRQVLAVDDEDQYPDYGTEEQMVEDVVLTDADIEPEQTEEQLALAEEELPEEEPVKQPSRDPLLAKRVEERIDSALDLISSLELLQSQRRPEPEADIEIDIEVSADDENADLEIYDEDDDQSIDLELQALDPALEAAAELEESDEATTAATKAALLADTIDESYSAETHERHERHEHASAAMREPVVQPQAPQAEAEVEPRVRPTIVEPKTVVEPVRAQAVAPVVPPQEPVSEPAGAEEAPQPPKEVPTPVEAPKVKAKGAELTKDGEAEEAEAEAKTEPKASAKGAHQRQTRIRPRRVSRTLARSREPVEEPVVRTAPVAVQPKPEKAKSVAKAPVAATRAASSETPAGAEAPTEAQAAETKTRQRKSHKVTTTSRRLGIRRSHSR